MAKRRAKRGDEKRAVAYLRVSTEDQRLGPEAQRAAVEAWAARSGVEVVAWFTDHGVSGGAELADRPALLDALAALEPHGAGRLVVAKRDRLARDVIVAAMVEREAEKHGARVVAADGAGDGEGPEALLMRRIVDAFAEYERALIRARTRAALQAKRARGERAGTVPLGHVATEGGKLAPNAAELAVLERVRALRAEGQSVRGIVRRLEAEGFVSRTGRPVSKGSVENLLAKVAA